MTSVIRILGVDPGLRRAGWGVIERDGPRLSFIASGVATSPANAQMSDRLAALFAALSGVVDAYAPDEAAVEKTFVNSNPASALALGQARGVALLAPATRGLPVAEYAPNAIKKAVVGAGHADKAQIQAMIRVLLPKAGAQGPDAADALAIAICHAHHIGARRITVLAAHGASA